MDVITWNGKVLSAEERELVLAAMEQERANVLLRIEAEFGEEVLTMDGCAYRVLNRVREAVRRG